MLFKSIRTFITLTLLLIENLLINLPVVEDKDFILKIPEEEKYVAFLRIPDIFLEQPLYEGNQNDIDKNIIFVKGSDMPTKKNGNVIIAGHSGNSSISYFRYLYKLNIGDFIYLEYNEKNYKYKIDYRYIVNKTGTVELRKDSNTNTLTLITCYGDKKQLVLVANLVK